MSLRATVRSLARAPMLAIAVALMVGFGVAALTTTFGIVHAALFREPPFPDARRLAMLYLLRDDDSRQRRERWSFGRIQLLSKAQRNFERVANYTPSSLTLAGDADAELVRAEMVSWSYFPLLRVTPARGRMFSESEDDAARPTPVAIVGHALWIRRFAGDSAIVGRAIRLNGVALTVVGIAPEGFHGLSGTADVWVPATMAPRLTYAEYVTTNQNFISVVGRLRPGVELTEAQSELAVLGATVNRALPSDPTRPDERVSATAISVNRARVDATVKRSLYVLLGAVVLLHLLACANVTNLLLGRAAAKRQESAVRVALGSSATQLFGRILADGMLLAGIGAALGIALAWVASSVIAPPTNVWAPRNFYGSMAPFDTPAFGGAEAIFGAVLGIATILLVALPPAMTAFGIDVSSGVRAVSRGIAGGAITLRRPSARGFIVGIEAALAMLLVIAAGLLIDSFQRMRQAKLGVDAHQVLTFWVIPSEVRVPPATAPAFIARLLEAVRRVPGVVSATVDGGAPLSGTASSVLYIVGRPAPAPRQAPPVLRHYVAPSHFNTMGIPLVRGRAFTDGDVHGAPRVTVISEGAVRKFWPKEDPLGKRVWFGGGSTFNSPDSSAEIVGIVGDVVYAPLDQRPNLSSFYTPYMQFTYAARMVYLRTAGPPMAVVPDVRKAVAAVDPEVGMRDVQSLEDIVNGSWARHRFDAILFGGFGIAAMLLAASGIFAVLAYAVGMRTREFGIRIALGAEPLRVIGQVVREGLGFPLVGLVLGAGAAVASTRVLGASLYEISPLEPRIFLRTALLLLAVATAACLVPAWRATRVDPMEALRAD